jgi:uncharacterized protein (DUF58 family)
VTSARGGLTTRATCLIAAGATALLCGVFLGVVDLVRAGVLALAVPAVSALVVLRSRVLLTNRRSVEPARTESGGTVVVHLTLTNRSLLRVGPLMLEDQLPTQLDGRARFVLESLARREVRTVSYRMPRLARGRYRAGPLRIRLTDPFHLVDVLRSFSLTSDFVVTPKIDALGNADLSRTLDVGDAVGSLSVGSHGADDASTREYRMGDDLRKIHWRSSARVGALMVRQEERPSQGQVTVALDLRSAAHLRVPGDDSDAADDVDERYLDSMEWAISAAASIGTHVLLDGRPLMLLDDAAGDPVAFSDAVALSDHLAAVRQTRAATLTAWTRPLSRLSRESTLVAVLGLLDEDSLRALATVHPLASGQQAVALLLDLAGWSGAGAGIEERVQRSAGVLAGMGWQAVVVPRGQSLPAVWRRLAERGVGARAAAWTAGGRR